MAAKRDYYSILGVSRNAPPEEIRKAHRRLVRQYHPDANRNNPEAGEKFKEVQEAYDVLSDTEKRQQYDQFGHAPAGGGASSPGNVADPYEAYRRAAAGRSRTWRGGPNVTVEDFEVGGGFSDVFEQFFGSRGGRKTKAQPEQQRGDDIEQTITLTFEQAAMGCTIPLQIQRQGRTESLDLKIPAGVKEGSRVRLRGKGHPGMGGQNGDLYIITHVSEHPHFRRVDLNIYIEIPISIYEAIKGAKIDVPTLEGRVTITIPPGTSGGAKLRLKGRGIKRGDERGDEFVIIRVVVPKNLDEEGRRMVDRLAAHAPLDARRDLQW